jgi:anti-sigma factor RsiW
MNCNECRLLLDAYVDGELDVRGSLDVESHIATCRACAAETRARHELSRAIRRNVSRFEPRGDFVEHLQASIAQHDMVPRRTKKLRTVAVALSLAAALVLVWLAARWSFGTVDAERMVADEVVAAHVRSLQVDHLTDVTSSDRHTVNPWFQGKVPFVPAARDFADHGFPLVGGRLDYVDGRAAAALVYRHGAHPLNVFTWPSDAQSDMPLHVLSVRGFSIGHFAHAGLQRWIVSDADPSAVTGLAALLTAPE